ncbi:hypothetical protein F2Q68_00011294 [Brassica cretica]|uniref:GST N-terminal domain-containing protein n=1 Tax=Brassica cretica TaxID=69181 RepID=A0A8S9KX52_BRACR|nr:hypothetical protein F2Q68_00011294 [Brassica cretica]
MKINPMGTVPALVDGEVVITDSFAIIMMRSNPEPPLLPRDLHKRALNYQRYIEEKTNGEEKIAWVNNAIRKGYTVAQVHGAMIKFKIDVRYIEEKTNGEEKIAWVNNAIRKGYTVAQVHGAMIKFKIDVEPYQTLAKCYESYKELSVFEDAVAAKRPDAPALMI